jgi:hypothetical protein
VPDYIIEPLDTDADAIYQDFVAYVQITFPDWEPSEGQLDVIIARYFAMQTAFTADMASRVQRAIFRYFGSSLANIPPLIGSRATATINFVIDDPATPPVDRTLPFGTLVGLTDDDGDIQMFELMDDMEVAAGVTSVDVDAEALEAGIVTNNISGTVELIEQVDWITSASVVGTSTGGSDPEQDDHYIQRLTENLALMAPRPILADDFTVFARNIQGVARAAVIDNFNPGVNEIQRITSNYTAGNWKATFGGQQTANIPATATAAQFRTAMAALSNFDVTDGIFTGGPLPGTPLEITFIGKYGYANQAPITIDSSGLSSGSSIAVSEVAAGAAYAVDRENSIGISAVDLDGNPLSDIVRDQLIAYLESTRAQNFLITFIAPAYYTVDVTYTVRISKGEAADSVKTRIDENLAQYLSPANWGKDPFGQDYIWVKQSALRYLELTTLVENTPGVDYIESLTFRIDGGALTTADKTIPAAFGLTRPGIFNGTIDLPI